jgi:hypothetical protein
MIDKTVIAKGYDPAGDVNVRGFAGSMTTYAALLAGLGALLKSSDRQLPDGYSLGDVVLGGVATHKLSRLLTKGSIASPLRAPFTEFVEPAGSAEHHEQPRGKHGVRHTIGELLTCPFCLGVWVGTAYVAGLTGAPRPTRALAAVFSVAAVSDALQQAYARLRTD